MAREDGIRVDGFWAAPCFSLCRELGDVLLFIKLAAKFIRGLVAGNHLSLGVHAWIRRGAHFELLMQKTRIGNLGCFCLQCTARATAIFRGILLESA